MRKKDSAPEEEIFEDDLEPADENSENTGHENIENHEMDEKTDEVDESPECMAYIDENTGEIIVETPKAGQAKASRTRMVQTDKNAKSRRQPLMDEEIEDDSSAMDDDTWEDEEDGRRGGGATVILIALLVAAATAAAGFFMYHSLVRKNKTAVMETEAMTEATMTEEVTESEEMTETKTEEETNPDTEAIIEPETADMDEAIDESEPVGGTTAETAVSADALSSQTETDSGSTVTVGSLDNTDSSELIEVVDGALEEGQYGSQYGAAGGTSDGTGADTDEETRTASVVMIGDIRFREMANIAEIEDCGWACSSSADYDWFVNNACPGADSMITSGTKVFISVGLNDIDRYTEYASTIKEMAGKWQERGASVYFVSVGPVAPESGVSNNDICTFNTYMFQNLDIPFIDAYNYLVSNGFSSVSDQSKSYSDETTLTLYNYIIQFI